MKKFPQMQQRQGVIRSTRTQKIFPIPASYRSLPLSPEVIPEIVAVALLDEELLLELDELEVLEEDELDGNPRAISVIARQKNVM